MADTLVTGGSGFVGRHLVKRLKSLGGNCFNLDIHDIKNRIDISDFVDCYGAVCSETPMIVFHLAAQPIVGIAKNNPYETLHTNIVGTFNLLESLRTLKTPPKAIVVFTTDKVYGNCREAKENDTLEGILHPYDVSKVCEDGIAQMYAHFYNLPISIIRCGNIYGGGDTHFDRIVPGTCLNLFHNLNPILRSDGSNVRDYVYIDDVINGIILVAKALATGRIKTGEVFNLGSYKGSSVLEVVNQLSKISGKNLKPVVLNIAKDELEYQHLNWNKINSTLGWKPKTRLEEGLKKTWEWYSKCL